MPAFRDAEDMRLHMAAVRMQFDAIARSLEDLGKVWAKFIEENRGALEELGATFPEEVKKEDDSKNNDV